jgi:hypothetical protein
MSNKSLRNNPTSACRSLGVLCNSFEPPEPASGFKRDDALHNQRFEFQPVAILECSPTTPE